VRLRGTIAFLSGLLLMLGAGWFAFPLALYETIEQPLQFSHDAHTGEEKAGMACEDCHSFREDGTFAGIPKLENCEGCHSEAQGESVAEKILFEQYISTNREIPWLVYARQPDNVYFSHIQHVRLAEINCERCHGPHGRTETLRSYERNRISGYSRDIWGRSISGIARAEWDGMKMDDCVACHAERGVVDSCLLCHK
jgi:menaquinone reductase, multiheme cytochrome c subunit